MKKKFRFKVISNVFYFSVGQSSMEKNPYKFQKTSKRSTNKGFYIFWIKQRPSDENLRPPTKSSVTSFSIKKENACLFAPQKFVAGIFSSFPDTFAQLLNSRYTRIAKTSLFIIMS